MGSYHELQRSGNLSLNAPATLTKLVVAWLTQTAEEGMLMKDNT
jgi:hypothetical protein